MSTYVLHKMKSKLNFNESDYEYFLFETINKYCYTSELSSS